MSSKATKTELSDYLKNSVRFFLSDFSSHTSATSRIFGTILIILSAFLLTSDVWIERYFPLLSYPDRYDSIEMFIVYLKQGLVPIWLLIAIQFRPYRISYAIPFCIGCVQLARTFTTSDDIIVQAELYSVLIIIISILLYYISNKGWLGPNEEREAIRE